MTSDLFHLNNNKTNDDACVSAAAWSLERLAPAHTAAGAAYFTLGGPEATCQVALLSRWSLSELAKRRLVGAQGREPELKEQSVSQLEVAVSFGELVGKIFASIAKSYQLEVQTIGAYWSLLFRFNLAVFAWGKFCNLCAPSERASCIRGRVIFCNVQADQSN